MEVVLVEDQERDYICMRCNSTITFSDKYLPRQMRSKCPVCHSWEYFERVDEPHCITATCPKCGEGFTVFADNPPAPAVEQGE